MSYAQTNYQQKQGVKGIYTIAQIGCFITSFCNLMERLNGSSIDPPAVNNQLIKAGAYIDVDDGVVDDVGWGTVSVIDPSIVVTGLGTGLPTTNNSIVKFVYDGNKTHFCLVADAAKGLIIDSWDGRVKHWSVYGSPKAYATYAKVRAQAPSINSGGAEMITSEEQVRSAYIAYLVKQPNAEELRQWLSGGGTLAALMSALDRHPEHAQTVNSALIGRAAQQGNWLGRIAELEALAASFKDRPTKEQADALQQAVTTCAADLQKQASEVKILEEEKAKDTETGNSILRFLGNWWNRNK